MTANFPERGCPQPQHVNEASISGFRTRSCRRNHGRHKTHENVLSHAKPRSREELEDGNVNIVT